MSDQPSSTTYVEGIIGRAAGKGAPGRPGAAPVLQVGPAKVVAFEFETGDELHEHAARHPVIIQAIRGRLEFTVDGRTVELVPGSLIYLEPMVTHAVRASEPSTLTVTMLLPQKP